MHQQGFRVAEEQQTVWGASLVCREKVVFPENMVRPLRGGPTWNGGLGRYGGSISIGALRYLRKQLVCVLLFVQGRLQSCCMLG
jgi:hypothetical protein